VIWVTRLDDDQAVLPERIGHVIGIAMVKTSTVVILAAAGVLSFAAGFCAERIYVQVSEGGSNSVLAAGSKIFFAALHRQWVPRE
jgi:hypothetical protein